MNETIGGAPQEQAAVSNTRNKKRRKLHIKGNIFPVVAWTAVALWCLIFLGLLFWAFINSLKTYINFYEDPLFFPKGGEGYGWNFANYVKAFSALKIVREGREIMAPEMLLNSLLYAGGSGVVSVITACLASYILAKYSYLKWVRGLWVIVLITNYLPIGTGPGTGITTPTLADGIAITDGEVTLPAGLNATVQVFDLNGHRVLTTTDTRFSLAPGLYIIQAGQEAVKVSVR